MNAESKEIKENWENENGSNGLQVDLRRIFDGRFLMHARDLKAKVYEK